MSSRLKSKTVRPAALLPIATIALAASVPVAALEVDLAALLTGEHSNNTFLTEDDETNNFSLSPGLLLNANHDGPSLQAGLEYQFERRFHTESDNTERNFLRGAANIRWSALPDRLEFNIIQSSTESTLNARQFGQPNDRIVTDNLKAGPTLMFRVRDTDSLRFTYLYEERNDPIDQNDSTSDVLAGSYTFQLSEFTSLTAEHREEEIEFDSDLTPDLDVTKQTLSINYRNEDVSFLLTGGYSEFEREGADTIDGAVGELDWSKQFGQRRVRVFAQHQITNQSSRLFTELEGFDLSNAFLLFLNTNIAEVFTETDFGVELSQGFGANRVSFIARGNRTDFEDFIGDTRSWVFSVGLERLVRRNMTLGVTGRYRRYEEDAFPGTILRPATDSADSKFFETRGTMEWSIASNLDLLIGLEYRNLGGGVDETISFVTATYDLFRRN